MTGLLIFGILALIGIVAVQVGKMTELSAQLRGSRRMLNTNPIDSKAIYGMVIL